MPDHEDDGLLVWCVLLVCFVGVIAAIAWP